MFIAKDPVECDGEAPRPLSDLSPCGEDPACRGLAPDLGQALTLDPCVVTICYNLLQFE